MSTRCLKVFIATLLSLSLVTAFAQSDSGYFKSFDGTRIYYEVSGSGKPVLLIHGFTGKGTDFKSAPFYDSLQSEGLKLILVDMRGNGKSDKPHEDKAYENDAEARDLMGLMRHLKIKKYEALGYSRGSIILARLLVKDDHVTRAVIGGMGADFTNPEWPRRIGIYKALMFDSSNGYEEFKKSIAQRGLDRLSLAYQQKWQPSTSPAELSRVKKPVLIICGDHDRDNGDGRELQKLIPGSEFIEVPGNHGSAMRSTEFAHAVASFFK